MPETLCQIGIEIGELIGDSRRSRLLLCHLATKLYNPGSHVGHDLPDQSQDTSRWQAALNFHCPSDIFLAGLPFYSFLSS